MKFSLKSLSFATILSFPFFAFAAFDYTALQPIAIPGGGSLYDKNILKYLANIYTFAIAIAGGLAVIKIVWAGTKYMLSDVVTDKSNSIKEIQGAVYGLLMALGAFVFLETLNPNLVKFNLNISATNKIQGDAEGLYNTIQSSGVVGGSRGVGGGSSNFPLVNANGVTVVSGPGSRVIGAGEANIDFDGSPGAYRVVEDPNGSFVINGRTYSSVGYENLANAGSPGDWYGVQTDSNGQPIINSDGTLNGTLSYGGLVGQGDNVAFAALTSQQIAAIRETNPSFGLGDSIIVTNPATNVSISAVYADYGGSRGINHAEVSPAAAAALGITYGRNSSGRAYAQGSLQYSIP